MKIEKFCILQDIYSTFAIKIKFGGKVHLIAELNHIPSEFLDAVATKPLFQFTANTFSSKFQLATGLVQMKNKIGNLKEY